MYENARLFFSILWLISVGAAFASGLAVLASWGGFTEYFYAALALVAISSAGAVITSL